MYFDSLNSFDPAIANQTLAQVYDQLDGDEQADIPRLVWLLENPASPIALPGNINLRNHDYLHILLGCGQSAEEEAFVVGFTMGNDLSTKAWQVALFKFCAQFLYPIPYRFSDSDQKIFDLGFHYGRSLKMSYLNELDFDRHQHETLTSLRQKIGIHRSELQRAIKAIQPQETALVNEIPT
jgi:hypothetical protein